MKGIDKGDIVSSGMPQVSKDGSVGRNSMDAVPSKQTKLGAIYHPLILMFWLFHCLPVIFFFFGIQGAEKICQLLEMVIK